MIIVLYLLFHHISVSRIVLLSYSIIINILVIIINIIIIPDTAIIIIGISVGTIAITGIIFIIKSPAP